MAWTQKPKVFLDLETSGLDPTVHEITEFAGIKEHRRGCFSVRREVLELKVLMKHPDRADPKALEIQGYDPDCERTPEWVAYPLIREFLSDCSFVVGHNVTFDWSFLQALSDRAVASEEGILRQKTAQPSDEQLKETQKGARLRYLHKIDTITLAAEHLVPCGVKKLGLDPLCKFLGIKNLKAHTALSDAEACRQLYHKLDRASFLKRLWWKLKRRFV